MPQGPKEKYTLRPRRPHTGGPVCSAATVGLATGSWWFASGRHEARDATIVTPAPDAARAVRDPSNTMSIDLALTHGTAQFSGTPIDGGWDDVPAQVSAAQAELNEMARDGGTRRKHRHARAVSGAPEGLHTTLVERASAGATISASRPSPGRCLQPTL